MSGYCIQIELEFSITPIYTVYVQLVDYFKNDLRRGVSFVTGIIEGKHSRRNMVSRILLCCLLVMIMRACVVDIRANASVNFALPLNGLQKSTGYSGFIPNRVISESSNTAAHLSQDYVSSIGDWNVMAIYAGTVIVVHNALSDGAGRYVILQHSINGVTVYSEYQHLLSIGVSYGQTVSAGQVIGVAGQSGTSEYQYGRHLHIAIYTGVQDAWAPRLTQYAQNVVYDGPIEYAGTTYYNPDRVLYGQSIISGTDSGNQSTGDSWTYRVLTTDGLNMRASATTSGSLITTLQAGAIVIVTRKTTANGYTWGYGTSNTGYTGWIVVDNGWTTLTSSTVDSTAPTISNVQVYDVSSSGYTVSCSVSDNVGVTKVAFPTWTTNNGQDDLFSDWGNTALGTISNGTATYRVNTSQHNNETGCTYITHIYAYDAAGNTGHVNQSSYGDLQVQVPTPSISTTGIQLDRSSVDVDLGSSGDKSFSLVATIHPSNATNKTVHWSSSNQTVARVDDNGLVTPTTVGSTVITAMAENGGYQATCTVNVSTWINGISLNTIEATLNLADHETLQLTKTITPNTATNKNVVWNSTDTSVATVSSNGLVTPVGTGVAVITCTAQDPGGFFALCAVTVVNNIDVESIDLNQGRIVFDHPNDSGSMLYASFTPENATRTNLTWMSSDESVATVSSGIVLPQHEGYTKITCTAESGATAVCDVVVHAEEIMNLPASLKTIKARAFYGSSIREVVIPGSTTTIGAKAFANCDDLRLVIIPNNVTNIASDAFNGSDNVVFICETNSYAAEYAAAKQITAVLASMPESVTIYADATTIVNGQSLWLGAEVIPSGVSQRVTWSIVDGKSIANIDQAGMLTTNGAGQVSIAATAINGATGIVSITVLEKPTTYTVYFDANGGKCDTGYLNARFNEALGTLPIPTRDYYTFNGWYTSASGGTKVISSTVYSDYDMGDITLYAHWTEHEWSAWVTEDELPTGTIMQESKQQYRYQDKVYSSWSAWGPRTQTRESTGELKKEQQLTEHYWYYDLCQNCGRHSPYTVCWDCGHNIGANWRVTWLDTSRNEGGQFGDSDKIFTMTEEGRWFYWTDDNGNGDSRIVYQYSTRTYAWSNWSEWSDVNVAASTTRNVESRYVYRYKLP